MTLSGYFMAKSVFSQQGCCALTFALARLSCKYVVTLPLKASRKEQCSDGHFVWGRGLSAEGLKDYMWTLIVSSTSWVYAMTLVVPSDKRMRIKVIKLFITLCSAVL